MPTWSELYSQAKESDVAKRRLAVVDAQSKLESQVSGAGGDGADFSANCRASASEAGIDLPSSLNEARRLRNRITHDAAAVSKDDAASAVDAYRKFSKALKKAEGDSARGSELFGAASDAFENGELKQMALGGAGLVGGGISAWYAVTNFDGSLAAEIVLGVVAFVVGGVLSILAAVAVVHAAAGFVVGGAIGGALGALAGLVFSTSGGVGLAAQIGAVSVGAIFAALAALGGLVKTFGD